MLRGPLDAAPDGVVVGLATTDGPGTVEGYSAWTLSTDDDSLGVAEVDGDGGPDLVVADSHGHLGEGGGGAVVAVRGPVPESG